MVLIPTKRRNKEYEVNWGMVYNATSPEDAVYQAIGDLAQIIALPTEGPNIFLVRCTEDPIDERNFVTIEACDAVDGTVEE